MLITSTRHKAAIALFERGGMTLTAIAAEVGVKRQTVSEWFAEWRKSLDAYRDATKSPDTMALKGAPIPAVPADIREVPLPRPAQAAARSDSTQLKPTSMAERRARARESILDDLRHGAPRKFATQRAGINRATFYAWLHGDEEFASAVEAAEADYVNDMTRVLHDEAMNGRPGQRWLPAMTSLERRFPQFFGRRANVAVDVEVRGQLDVRRVLSDPALIDQVSALEMAMQNTVLDGAVIEGTVLALPPRSQDDE